MASILLEFRRLSKHYLDFSNIKELMKNPAGQDLDPNNGIANSILLDVRWFLLGFEGLENREISRKSVSLGRVRPGQDRYLAVNLLLGSTEEYPEPVFVSAIIYLEDTHGSSFSPVPPFTNYVKQVKQG